jgi:hypothetical protein
LNAVPTDPFAVKELLITGIGGTSTIVIVKVLLSLPPAFVAVIFTVVVPLAAGNPLIKPVTALIDKPFGNGDAKKLVGVFVA